MRGSVIAAVALVLGILSMNIGVAFWNGNILYEGESIYNYLRVEEDDNSLILSTNVLFGVQSIKRKQGGLTGMYYDCALAAPAMAKILPMMKYPSVFSGSARVPSPCNAKNISA